MKEYEIIELKNGDKYILIDLLNFNNKKYFLLAKIILDDIKKEFYICNLNEENNTFSDIEDNLEYNFIKETFNSRLDRLKETLEKVKITTHQNIIKLKLIEINNNYYKFQKESGETIKLNIELYDNFKLEINDQIYMRKETTNEKITIRFGHIYSNEIEIIKIVRENQSYYLQRYYG